MLEPIEEKKISSKKTSNKPKIICSNCQDVLLPNEIHYNPDDQILCENCFRNQCIICEDCKEIIWGHEARTLEGSIYCNKCIWEYAFECASCNELDYSENSFYCDNCGTDYCHPCYDEDSCRDSDEQEQEQDLDFQEGRKSKLITVERFVGVELEAENGYRNSIYLPSTFGIKEDGSLNGSGVEIVTPPSKNGALIKNVKLACKQLDKAHFESTPSCGLHIHIDLRDLKDNFIKLSRILRTFYAVEDVMFAMLPDSRIKNQYCYPLRKYYNFYDFYGRRIAKEFDITLYGVKDKKRLADYKREHHNDKRYRACNFHSVFYRGTLEVRCHSASQNPTKILNWIELLLKITDWSINYYKHSTVEDLLKLNATEKKVYKMQRIFKFSKKIEKYINQRIKEFGQEGLKIPYNLGRLPKRKLKVGK